MRSYPLQYPENWGRTPSDNRKSAAFKTSFGAARDNLLDEIRLLGGQYPIISTNIPTRQDGLPYARYSNIKDVGVAVYFELFGEQQCIPCDKWNSIVDNIQAINKTVRALRGIERWGAKDMVKAAFKGFESLPPPDGSPIMGEINQPWHEILEISAQSNREEITKAFKRLAKIHHPDTGGNLRMFIKIKQAYNKGIRLQL